MEDQVIETVDTQVDAVEVETKDTAVETAAPTAQVDAPPQYQPNFKFSVHDEEKEFDEWMRPTIKDAETEKKVRELYEKAYGLDYVKPKHEAAQKELQAYASEYEKLHGNVNSVLEARDQGDFEVMLKRIGVTEAQIAKYLIEKQQRKELPPEQRQVYDREEQLRRDFSDRDKQVEILTQRYMDMASQAREAQVDFAMLRPEVTQVASAYDGANGKGSFKRLIAETAIAYQAVNRQEPSVETAISETLRRVGRGWLGSQVQPPSVNTVEAKPPVIPNVSGKQMSPIKKSPRTIKELREMGKSELYG